MSDILSTIVQHKQAEVAASRKRLPLERLREQVLSAQVAGPYNEAPIKQPIEESTGQPTGHLTGRPTEYSAACSPGAFARALRQPGRVSLIAEVKRKSPSKGLLAKDFNLTNYVRAYHAAGADAISILTDREFFGGAPEYLTEAQKITNLPLLRKDFIIDAYQIYESKLLGADAVLLIAGLFSGPALEELIALAGELGLDALVETRTEAEIFRAIRSGAKLIGINNRDLRNFEVDINTTLELIKYIDDPTVTVVSESGIKTRADVELLGRAGVSAVLVGEALMTCGDPVEGVGRLMGTVARKEAMGA